MGFRYPGWLIRTISDDILFFTKLAVDNVSRMLFVPSCPEVDRVTYSMIRIFPRKLFLPFDICEENWIEENDWILYDVNVMKFLRSY